MAEATEEPLAQPGIEPRMLKRRRRNTENPLVYFDVTIGGQSSGKIVMELFQDAVPKVSLESLVALCDLTACYVLMCKSESIVEYIIGHPWASCMSATSRRQPLTHCRILSAHPLPSTGLMSNLLPADGRELPAAVHRGGRGGTRHRTPPALQGEPIPPHHQGLHGRHFQPSQGTQCWRNLHGDH